MLADSIEGFFQERNCRMNDTNGTLLVVADSRAAIRKGILRYAQTRNMPVNRKQLFEVRANGPLGTSKFCASFLENVERLFVRLSSQEDSLNMEYPLTAIALLVGFVPSKSRGQFLESTEGILSRYLLDGKVVAVPDVAPVSMGHEVVWTKRGILVRIGAAS